MPIRNVLVEAWTALTATGLAIVALSLMFAPFLISVIANFGRPVPRTARSRKPRLRPASAPRTLPS
jgi:hypothetical protein